METRGPFPAITALNEMKLGQCNAIPTCVKPHLYGNPRPISYNTRILEFQNKYIGCNIQISLKPKISITVLIIFGYLLHFIVYLRMGENEM